MNAYEIKCPVKRRFDLALTAITSIAALAGCGQAPQNSKRTDQPAAKRIADIQRLDDRICLCEMAGRDASTLKKALGELTADLRSESFGTSSTPMTGNIICFPELDERACIGRIEMLSDPRQFVCTEEQARAVETGWTHEMDESTLRDRIESMRRELRRSLQRATCQLP